MDVPTLVEAVSAGAGSSVVVGGSMRRFWMRREDRQQAAFRRSVQQIVDESVADVLRRQAEAERRQGLHLDRQDRAIEALAAEVRRHHGLPPRTGGRGTR